MVVLCGGAMILGAGECELEVRVDVCTGIGRGAGVGGGREARLMHMWHRLQVGSAKHAAALQCSQPAACGLKSACVVLVKKSRRACASCVETRCCISATKAPAVTIGDLETICASDFFLL